MDYFKFREKEKKLEENEKKNEFKLFKLRFEYACDCYKNNEPEIYYGPILSICYSIITHAESIEFFSGSRKYKDEVKKAKSFLKKAILYLKLKRGTRGLNYYVLAHIFRDQFECNQYLDKAISEGVKETLEFKAFLEEKSGNHKAYFDLLNRYLNEGEVSYLIHQVMNKLAYCYIYGVGTDKDYEKGMALLEENYFKNHDDELIKYYYNFNGIGNYQKIVDLIKAIKKDNEFMYNRLLKEYHFKDIDVKNNTKANEYYKKAINNDGEASYKLYLCFKNGNGVVKDENTAFKWLKAAYDKGYLNARTELIECYEKGIGTDKNLELANMLCEENYTKEELYEKYKESNSNEEKMRWLKLSVNSGYDVAMNELANQYMNGEICTRDRIKAFDLYKQASEYGIFDAQVSLASCYIFGQGTNKNYPKAIELLNKIINTGDARVQYLFGMCYKNGYGVEKDYTKAFQYYNLATQQGHLNSIYNLGVCYYDGIGCAQNYNKSFECFKKCADVGDKKSYYPLGLSYYYGKGCPKDESKGIEYIKLAADSDNVYKESACYSIGQHYYNNKDYVNARIYLEKAHNNITESGCFGLYSIYRFGKGTDIDYKKAFYWIDKCSSFGNIDALVYIGDMYENGLGCEKDYNKAKEYYNKAIEKGNYKGAYYLAWLYYNLPSLRTKSKEYFELALKNGIYEASYFLGVLAAINKNYSKAKEYFEYSLNKGDNLGAKGLGILYFCGEGVKRDFDKAKKYLDMVVDDINGVAANILGEIYSSKKEYSKAMGYFNKAMERGNGRAIWNLGNMYYYGEGVSKDYDIAFDYFVKARSKDYNLAWFSLGRCYYYGRGCRESNEKALEYFSKVKNPTGSILRSINQIKGFIEEEENKKYESSNSSYDDDYSSYSDYDSSDDDYSDDSSDDLYYDVNPYTGDIDYSSTPITINPYTGMGSDGVQYEKDIWDDTYHPVDDDDD